MCAKRRKALATSTARRFERRATEKKIGPAGEIVASSTRSRIPTVIQHCPAPQRVRKIVRSFEGPAMEPEARFRIGQIVGVDKELLGGLIDQTGQTGSFAVAREEKATINSVSSHNSNG